MPKKRKKRNLTPWGKLRIQAGTAARQGEQEKADVLRAEADRLEAEAKTRPQAVVPIESDPEVKVKRGRGRPRKVQPPTPTFAHIEKICQNLGLSAEEALGVFRAGLRATLNEGLRKQ